jgi:hypothetical protein
MPEVPVESQPFEIGEPFELSVMGDEDDEPAESKPRSRARRIVMAVLLAIVVFGGGALAYAGWQIRSQKDATLSVPPTIGALRLDDSEDGKTTADYLQTALSAEVDLDKAVGAVYNDSSNHSILFFGGTTLIWSPEKDLDTAFGLISDNQGAVTGLHKVDAGKLGGTMKCGTTKSDDGTLAVCGWADHGSLALAMFPGRSESDSAKLLLDIRDATQKRS